MYTDMNFYVSWNGSLTIDTRTCLLVLEHRPSLSTHNSNTETKYLPRPWDSGIISSLLSSSLLDYHSLKWCSNLMSNSLYQACTAFVVLSTIPHLPREPLPSSVLVGSKQRTNSTSGPRRLCPLSCRPQPQTSSFNHGPYKTHMLSLRNRACPFGGQHH